MNELAKYCQFDLDPNRFSQKDLLYQNDNVSIERVLDSQANKTFIIHTLPLIGFEVSALSDFAKALLKNPDNKYLLPLYGLVSTSTHIKIVYNDLGVSIVDPNKLNSDKKMEMLKTISKAVAYLHSKNISHLRIKVSSIFCTPDNNSFFLGCITPVSIIDLENEDRRLPFYQQPLNSRDSYMFGLLIFELLLDKIKTQKDLLKQFWRFEEFPSDKPIFELAKKCLLHDFKKRPSFNEILTFFGEEQIDIDNSCDSNQILIEASNQINNVFFLLIRGITYSSQNDYQNAIQVYKSDLLRDIPHAINNIAVLISKDKSDESLSKAADLFHQASDLGFATSQRNYSYALRNGIGVLKNHTEQINYLLKSAKQGFIDSLFGLYTCLFEDSDPKCVKYLRRAAYKTYPPAIHMYGLLIEQGIGYPGDISINFFWVGAQNHYAYCLNNYATRIKDIRLSNQYWKEAAEIGSKHAQYNYAVSLLMGRGGVEINKEAAAALMKKSADQIYAPSMFDYALMLREGIGVPKNEEAAEELCIKAGKVRILSEVAAQETKKRYQDIRDKLNR